MTRNIDTFARALMPDRTVVFGHRLYPFALGHWLLLQRVGSPFVGDWSKAGLPETILAAILCARQVGEAQSIICSGWMPLRLKLACWQAILRYPRWTWVEQAAAMAAHTRCVGLLPTVRQAQGEAAVIGAPPLLGLLTFLVCRAGMSIQEALGMPVAVATQLQCAFWESEGRMNLRSDEEVDVVEYLKTHEKEILGDGGQG